MATGKQIRSEVISVLVTSEVKQKLIAIASRKHTAVSTLLYHTIVAAIEMEEAEQATSEVS